MSDELGDARTRDFDATIGPWIEPGYRLAVAMLRDPEEAHDAVREATVNAWRSLDRLCDSSQARAWFLAIVANLPIHDAQEVVGSASIRVPRPHSCMTGGSNRSIPGHRQRHEGPRP